MRKLSVLIAPAAAAGLIAAVLPATAANAAKYVPPELFGQHIAGVAGGVPATLAGGLGGSVRIWDSGLSWRDLQPNAGAPNLDPLRTAVAQIEGRFGPGVEILYTVGNTPTWAATKPNDPKALYGASTNSHPALGAYVDFVKAVAGVPGIDAIQIWNEANLADFYNGTPTQMARLTVAAGKALKGMGWRGTVVAASTTVRSKGPVNAWGKQYGKAMKKAKAWKYVNAVSAHFYPPATKGPNERVKYIKKTKAYYKRWGAKKKPLWDTEMNFGDQRSYMKVKRYYDGDQAAAYVARAYLDSLRYGVARVFWYGWNIQVLGLDMTSRDGTLKAGGQAYLTAQDWLAGARWYGCKTKSKVTTCKIRSRAGAKQQIRFTTSKSKTIRVPKGQSTMTRLDRTVTPVTKGQKVKITTYPVLFG